MTFVFLLSGVVEMAIAMPMIRGKIRRNALYGFRTPKTLASDAIWYPANAYAGRAMFAAGFVLAAGCALLLPFAAFLAKDTVVFVGLALTFVPMILVLVKSFQFIRRL